MKKMKLLLISTLSIGLSFIYTSCDSSPSDDESTPIVTSRGINLEEVTANPSDLAVMPKVLLPGEIISHSPAEHLDIRQISQLGTSAVINSAGGLDIDNIALQYAERDGKGFFQLAPKHQFSDFDPNIIADFQARMDLLIEASTNSNDSLQTALGSRITNDSWIAVLDAARSIDILTALGPEPEFITNVPPDTLLPLVLIRRSVTYEVESTNQELLDNQIIRGTYEISDLWAIPTLLAVESGDPLDSEFDQITLRVLPNGSLATIPDDSRGEFTLNLNSL